MEAELITAIADLLDVEPTAEEGQCPWCGVLRADWAGWLRRDHEPECPWPRLASAFAAWVAD